MTWVKPKVLLFDNDNASFTGATTLSETAANFVCLDILLRTNDSDYGSVRVYRPNGKRVSLQGSRRRSNQNRYNRRNPIWHGEAFRFLGWVRRCRQRNTRWGLSKNHLSPLFAMSSGAAQLS